MQVRQLLFIILFFIASVKSYAQVTFKGGQAALNEYLSAHIVYPEYSRQNCISATIKVQFNIDSTGSVANVAVQDGLGIDLDDEAVRVIKMTSGKWLVSPGYNSSKIILPVHFKPDNTRCGYITEANMAAAIASYKVQQELQNAVTNYYKNKYAGKTDRNEAEIIALKKQLGYNEEFIADMLNQAGEKLKQGDKAGACEDWNFVHNIGSNKADSYLTKYCK